MNSARMGLRVAALIFGLISVAHLWRAITHFEVQIGQYQMPQWPSGAAVILFGLLSVWLWRLSVRAARL